MYFIVAALVIIVSCSVITIRVLTAYSGFFWGWKLLISSLVILGWTAPLIIGAVRRYSLFGGMAFNFLSGFLYSLFGMAFILFCFLMLRDFLWFAVYKLAVWSGHDIPGLNPMNVKSLNWANLLTVILSFAVSAYALYEGVKTPRLNEITLTSSKISRPAEIVLLNDLHVDRTTPLSRIQALIAEINGLHPDAVIIAGDWVDDQASAMVPQIAALSELKAPHGVYIVLGNHEFYNGLADWLQEFPRMGYKLLYNEGVALPEYGIYIAGIPDSHSAKGLSGALKVDIYKALQASAPEDFRILLSHSPDFIDSLYRGAVDLVVSGHTHGGQIFPFHWLVKKANGYLAGLYNVKDMNLYVSRGAGTWGPSMRLLAPAEITLIKLNPKK